MLTVHYVIPKTNFTITPNEIMYDERMSVLARHVLMSLCGRPPGWQTTADQMWQQARKNRGKAAEGRRAWRDAFAELEKFGYLKRRRVRVGSAWETHTDVYSEPRPVGAGEEASDAPTLGRTGFGPPETGTSLVSTDVVSTESSSAVAGSPLRVEHENSSALPDGSTANRRRDTNQQPSIPRPRRVQNRRPHPTPLADLQALYDQDRIDEDDLWAVLEEGFAGVDGVNESTVYGMLGSWHVAAIAKYLEAETGVRPVWEDSGTLTVLLRHWGDGEPHRRGDLRAAHAMAA